MPKRTERRIEREYRRKGYSLKSAKHIAFATMNARGLLRAHRHRGKGKRGGHGRTRH